MSLNALLPINIFNKIDYYVLSDSQSTCLQLLNKSKPGVHLTLTKKVEQIFDSIEKTFDIINSKSSIKFVWVNGQFNPSDINSKMCTDFTQSQTIK